MKNIIRTNLLVLLSCYFINLQGQTKLHPPLILDTIAKKMKIKEAIVHNYTTKYHRFLSDWYEEKPSSSTVERFDTRGRIIQRINISYTYGKHIYNYQYQDKKDYIKVKEIEYDWNPGRVYGEDTIILKSKTKYTLDGKPYSKRKQIYKPIIKYKYDSLGRILKIETPIKCGIVTEYCSYGKNGKIKQISTLATIHHDTNYMSTTEYKYNQSNQLIEKIHNSCGKKTVTKFSYNSDGLITEKIIERKYKANKSTFWKSIYTYTFY